MLKQSDTVFLTTLGLAVALLTKMANSNFMKPMWRYADDYQIHDKDQLLWIMALDIAHSESPYLYHLVPLQVPNDPRMPMMDKS
jgi:hypothetical protein